MRNDGRHAPLDTVTDIDTPERTRFSCRLAGPGQRALAYLIDCVVRAAVLALLLAVILGAGLVLVGLFVVEWCYYVACELWLEGQSFGKRALHLRVVCNDGLPIGLRESILRNLLRAADFLPSWYVIGGLVMSLDPQFRRLGDLVAGTFVIVEGKEPILPAIAISPAPTLDELRALPAHVVFQEQELDAIDHLMRRKLNLSSARTRELATLLAPGLAQRWNVQYTDPVRFLALVYHRATHSRAS
jgi:uncharacterized RDD family membrane protein YckC